MIPPCSVRGRLAVAHGRSGWHARPRLPRPGRCLTRQRVVGDPRTGPRRHRPRRPRRPRTTGAWTRPGSRWPTRAGPAGCRATCSPTCPSGGWTPSTASTSRCTTAVRRAWLRLISSSVQVPRGVSRSRARVWSLRGLGAGDGSDPEGVHGDVVDRVRRWCTVATGDRFVPPDEPRWTAWLRCSRERGWPRRGGSWRACHRCTRCRAGRRWAPVLVVVAVSAPGGHGGEGSDVGDGVAGQVDHHRGQPDGLPAWGWWAPRRRRSSSAGSRSSPPPGTPRTPAAFTHR